MGILCLFDQPSSFSQYSSGEYQTDVFPTYLVFLEAGGHGLASLNYEHYLSKRLGIRVGYGIYIPVLLNFYFGERYLLEIGVGGMYPLYRVPERFVEKVNQLLLGCTIGHKFQPIEGGLTLRYSFTPIFNPSNGRLLPMFGLSIGLAFQ